MLTKFASILDMELLNGDGNGVRMEVRERTEEERTFRVDV